MFPARLLILAAPLVALAACSETGMSGSPAAAPRTAGSSVGTSGAAEAQAEGPGGGARPVGSPTVSQPDTASAAKGTGAGARLGTTVASLGDATDPGFWIKTPLVRSIGKGRIVNPATGQSAGVELRPLGGPPSGGSQVSLPAMQAVGAGLTDLPRLEVWGSCPPIRPGLPPVPDLC